uniref:C-type lectin domain-containing protein n=1 Tax=Panagrolaimus superbus TaxID=310955 RepID=A0A914Z346_9BILA
MAVTPKNFKWSNSNWGKMIPFICEVPRFPKAFCEPGWILHMKSRSCLYLNKIVSNFPTAAMKCRELGSNVASINDETENELALKMINKAGSNEQVWIGLRWDAARSNIADIPGKNPYETFTFLVQIFC